MTTTNAWLQAQGAAGEMAMSLAFDGLDLVYTTTADTAGIATAFAPTSQWTTVKGGLYVTGSVSQEIQAFAPRITTQSMQFTILDVDGSLRQKMLGSISTAASTFATEDIDPTDATFFVQDTTDFAASGTVYIGHETIAYSSKTGAPDHSFVTSQRGKFSLFGADGSDYFKRRHAGGLRRTEAPGRGVTPEIRSIPDTFYNRQVALILHHKETTATTSLWSTVDLPLTSADSKVLWVGRIKEWSDNGDGSLTLTCISSHELLTGHVFSRQFRGTLAPGGYVTSVDSKLQVAYSVIGGAYNYDLDDGQLRVTSGWVDKFYTYGDLIGAINEQLNEWADDGSMPTNGGNPNHRIQFAAKYSEVDGVRVYVEIESISSLGTDLSKVHVHLSPRVWSLLGFSTNANLTVTATSDQLEQKEIPRVSGSSTLFRAVADGPPAWYQNPDALRQGDRVVVYGESGEWMQQPEVPAEIDADGLAHGLLQVGDRIFGAYKSTNTLNGIETTTFVLNFALGEPVPADASRNLDASAEPPSVRQVWCERGEAGKLLLQLMLSTGEAGYNNATYDVYGAGLGLGIPHYQVDVGSFESLDTHYELLLDKPIAFRELLEEILTVYNRHIVIANGQLRLTRPGFDASSVEESNTLDESNKAEEQGSAGRPAITYSTAGVINHIVLSYTNLSVMPANKWLVGAVERSDLVLNVEDQTSINRFGSRRTLEIKARGITDPSAVAEYVVKPILRYFAEPSATIRRTINHRMFHLLPGDQVALTDNYVTDPASLTRGIVGMPCWVKAIACDYQAGRGEVELYFLPGNVARYAKFAPSALMTSYNAGTKTATFSAHAFSRTTDDVDVANFAALDEVQLVEMSPSTVGSPSVLTDVIASVNSGANTVTLVTGVSPTGGKTYVMEPREVASASVPTTTQRNAYVYLADEDDRKINATYTAKTWAGPTKSLDARTSGVTYTQQFVRPGTPKDATADEPLSSRKLMNLVNNCNVLLGYHTRNAASWVLNVNATSTSYRIAMQPVWLPLYGINPDEAFSRTLVGKILVERNAGTTTAKVVSCPSVVTGTSASVYAYPGYTLEAEVTRSAAGQVWADFELTPAISKIDGQLGTWLTVEVKNSSGSGFGSVRGLSICETKID